ncbi:hypothetical protein SESBI_27317 [Sesbania bispinosa]|nr:hypothetical protein SESBI_27317 [Sesbania bispinosa]
MAGMVVLYNRLWLRRCDDRFQGKRRSACCMRSSGAAGRDGKNGGATTRDGKNDGAGVRDDRGRWCSGEVEL